MFRIEKILNIDEKAQALGTYSIAVAYSLRKTRVYLFISYENNLVDRTKKDFLLSLYMKHEFRSFRMFKVGNHSTNSGDVSLVFLHIRLDDQIVRDGSYMLNSFRSVFLLDWNSKMNF